MKHILILNYEFPPVGGGGGTSSKYLAEAFAKHDLKVHVLTSWLKGLPKTESIDGYTVQRINCSRSKPDRASLFEMFCSVLFMIVPAIRYCMEEKPDLIHCNFAVPTGIVAFICKKLTGVPYVLTLHGGEVPSFNKPFVSNKFYFFSVVIKKLTSPVWTQACRVICASNYFYDLVRAEYPTITPVVIPFGIDLDFFYPKEKIRSNKISLLFFSRLTKQKGALVLLDSVKAFDKSLDWELNIIGDGPMRGEIAAKIEKDNLKDRVTMHGWQSKEFIREALWKSSVFVFPSLQESFGFVMLEAIATGTPAIVSDTPALQEIIDQTGFGVAVTDWDTDLLPSITKAQSLVFDKAKLANYSWEFTANKYLEEFTSCVN